MGRRVLEALQDIGAAQGVSDLLRVATARKRASMEVDRADGVSWNGGSMSQPPSRAGVAGRQFGWDRHPEAVAVAAESPPPRTLGKTWDRVDGGT